MSEARQARSSTVATGGDALVAVMDAFDVDCAFGVVSVHNLPLVDAVARARRFVPVRGEAAAVNAADGYGRSRGGLGVAITSTGSGAGNACGGLVESLTASSSLLHVTGQIDYAHLGRGHALIHETRDQLAMLRAVSIHAETIVDPTAAVEVLIRAATVAIGTPGGPVSVEWPIDLQYASHEWEALALRPALGTPAPSPLRVEEAARLLSKARRPLVWCGGGALEASPLIDRLLDRLGAGLLTSNAGRGTIREDDPRCVGNFASALDCQSLLEHADTLVSVGTRFRAHETRDFTIPLPLPHVQIDIDPSMIGRNYPATMGLPGHAAVVLEGLLRQLDRHAGGAEPGWIEEIRATRRSVREALRATIGEQATICDALRSVLPDRAVVVRDVTIPSSSWGNRLLEIYDARSNVFAHGGGIGQGLAMGIGAAVGRGDGPVVVLVGDGGLALSLGELLTMAQEQPWLVVVVFNDRGYGVLRNMQDHFIGRRSGVDLVTPDFALLSRSMGLNYARVERAMEFEAALRDAVAVHRTCVIEVDVDALAPMSQPFVPPVRPPEHAS